MKKKCVVFERSWSFNFKWFAGLILIVIGLLVFSLVVIFNSQVYSYGENLYRKIKIFTSIIETIQRDYIEEKNPDELINNAINGVLSNLDPHTIYLSADGYKFWIKDFEGYSGIGISFEIINDKVTVMSVIASGPAAKKGIQPGDKIIAIEGETVQGLKKEEFSKKLMGPASTLVNITVESKRWLKPKKIQLTRQRILLKSIPEALLIEPGIGYIKIERFTGKTSTELEKALKHLESQGMKNLILDLRGNSGGYLTAAIEVADKFIPGGNKILTTKGRLPSSVQHYYATSDPTHPLFPLIVLIDHGSASAAEIVAGAIQDLDRGLVIGKTSFGKGLVQSQYRFHDNSVLLISTNKWFTPKGKCIQRGYTQYNSKEEYEAGAGDGTGGIIPNIITDSVGDELITEAVNVFKNPKFNNFTLKKK